MCRFLSLYGRTEEVAGRETRYREQLSDDAGRRYRTASQNCNNARLYKRKSDRGTKSVELMKRAADLVNNENKSLSQICRDFELSKTPLSTFIQRMKNDPVNLRFGYDNPRQIFNKDQEANITEYLLKLAQIFHGIVPKEVRRMAYDCAIKYEIIVPKTWPSQKYKQKKQSK